MASETRETPERGEARALEAMVLRYRPLALSLARRYAGAGHAREDLEQVACEGLIKAVRRFDAERGCAFSTFAVPTILGELRRFCRDTGWTAHVPRGMQERARAVRMRTDELAASCSRGPTVAELAADLVWSEEEVVEAFAASGTRAAVPLDAPYGDAEDASAPVDRLGDVDPGFDRVECLAAIESSLPALSAAQKHVLRLRFEDDLRLTEIALRLDIPEGRVSRLLASALDTLRRSAAEGDAPAPTRLRPRRTRASGVARPTLVAA